MNLFLINTNVFTDILFWVYALIMFIVVLGVIILLHEGGHFFFAKKAGILCHEFSIGMGPVVKSKKKGETSYSIRAIPVGGFVSMAGEDTNEMMLQAGQTVSLAFKEVNYGSLFFNKEVEGSEALCNVVSEISLTDKVVKEVSGTVKEYDLYSENGDAMYIVLDINGKEEKFLVARDAYYVLSQKQSIQMAPFERCYESKTKLQRFLTVFAGPFMNFVLAFFIFLVVGLASGVPNTESSEIGGLTEGYGAASVLQVEMLSQNLMIQKLIHGLIFQHT
jgi:regulator of sigma E protease